MLIERTTLKSILPEVLDVLASNENAKMYCEEYCPPKRFPTGIFNVSLTKVISKFELVLDSLAAIEQEQPFRVKEKYHTKFDARLIESQENLIKSIQEYFDGCKDILRCFYPAKIGDDKSFFKQTDVDIYWQAIKAKFFTPVSEIANHIKHDQGKLIFFVMFNDEYYIPGYYVEALDENRRLCPYRKIHEPVRSILDPDAGYDTAFSFYRDLRFLFWGVYFVSHHLAVAIKSITRNNTITKYGEVGDLGESLLDVARRIQALPKRFYPDESLKDVPSVKIIDEKQEIILRVALTRDEILIGLDNKAHENMVPFISDGVTKDYKFPYWRASQL